MREKELMKKCLEDAEELIFDNKAGTEERIETVRVLGKNKSISIMNNSVTPIAIELFKARVK